MSNSTSTKHPVAPVELFFDLVFVFAFIQLSNYAIDHLTIRGISETIVMLIAVLTVWSHTSWVATMIPANRTDSVAMLLIVMFLGLFMNASIASAFEQASWNFVIPMLTIQIGRTIWTIINSPDEHYKQHFIRTLSWILITTPLWILGAYLEAEMRLYFWLAAALIELLGTWLAHPLPGKRIKSEKMQIDAEHMLERCNLFILIALGETILTTGASIAKHPTDLSTLIAGSSALVITISLWALTFGSAQKYTEHHIEKTLDKVKMSRHALSGVILMVLGLLTTAVLNKLFIQYPSEYKYNLLGLFMGVGPGLFLATQSWYLKHILNVKSKTHTIGAGTIILSGGIALVLPPYGGLLLVGGILAVIAALDWRAGGLSHANHPKQIDS